MKPPGQILLVDDDRDFVDIYRELLGALGLIVTVAHDGEEALEVLKTLGPALDVVLLDQKLQRPGGSDSGLGLIALVHGLAPFAKTIIVTGYPAHDPRRCGRPRPLGHVGRPRWRTGRALQARGVRPGSLTRSAAPSASQHEHRA